MLEGIIALIIINAVWIGGRLFLKKSFGLRNIYDGQLDILAMVWLGTSVVIATAVGLLSLLVRPHH